MLNLTQINASGMINNTLASFGKVQISLFEVISNWCHQLDHKIAMAVMVFLIFRMLNQTYKPIIKEHVKDPKTARITARVLGIFGLTADYFLIYVIVYSFYNIGFGQMEYLLIAVYFILLLFSFILPSILRRLQKSYSELREGLEQEKH